MNVMKSFKQWIEAKQDKKIEAMQAAGKCPDCYGRGFHVYAVDYLHGSPLQCPSCEGSGLFSDWEK